jgi:hypothetical protein
MAACAKPESRSGLPSCGCNSAAARNEYDDYVNTVHVDFDIHNESHFITVNGIAGG